MPNCKWTDCGNVTGANKLAYPSRIDKTVALTAFPSIRHYCTSFNKSLLLYIVISIKYKCNSVIENICKQ